MEAFSTASILGNIWKIKQEVIEKSDEKTGCSFSRYF